MTGDVPAVGAALVLAVGGEVFYLVVVAGAEGFHAPGQVHDEGVGTGCGGAQSGQSADGLLLKVDVGFLEPLLGFGTGQHLQDVEEDGAGGGGAAEVFVAFAVEVAYPYGDGVLGVDADGPGVFVSVAGACFPGKGAGAVEVLPVVFAAGAFEVVEHVEYEVAAAWTDQLFALGALLVWGEVVGCEDAAVGEAAIELAHFPDVDFAAAEDEGEAVVVGRPEEGADAGFFKEGVEGVEAVGVEQAYGGDVERLYEGFAGGDYALVFATGVAGREAVEVGGEVADVAFGGDEAFVDAEGVQEGFEDGAAGAWGADAVDLSAVFEIKKVGGAYVGLYGAGLGVGDH